MKILHVKIIIGLAICSTALSGKGLSQTPELKLVFEQEGKPIEVKTLSIDILDSETDVVLLTLKASGNIIVLSPDLDLPESFDVRVVFDQNSMRLNSINRNFFDGDWVVGFSDHKKRTRKCKGVLRIFRTDFHLTGKSGVFWLTSQCLPQSRKESR